MDNEQLFMPITAQNIFDIIQSQENGDVLEL